MNKVLSSDVKQPSYEMNKRESNNKEACCSSEPKRIKEIHINENSGVTIEEIGDEDEVENCVNSENCSSLSNNSKYYPLKLYELEDCDYNTNLETIMGKDSSTKNASFINVNKNSNNQVFSCLAIEYHPNNNNQKYRYNKADTG